MFSKNGAGGTIQKWNAKVRGRRDKGDSEVEQEFQRYIGARLYNVPHPFSTKNVVVELTVKLENAFRSESKSTAVRQKKIKLNEKGRLASAIILYTNAINLTRVKCCYNVHLKRRYRPLYRAASISLDYNLQTTLRIERCYKIC